MTGHRHDLVYPISKDLDNLFGLKYAYSDGHLWFLRCLVTSCCSVFPPDYNEKTQFPIPGPYAHYYQEGGFEGMKQKVWTLITISIIHLAKKKVFKDEKVVCNDKRRRFSQ